MEPDANREELDYDIVEGPPATSPGGSWVRGVARMLGSMTRSIVESSAHLTGGPRPCARALQTEEARVLLAQLEAHLAVRVEEDFAGAVESEELWRLIDKLARLGARRSVRPKRIVARGGRPLRAPREEQKETEAPDASQPNGKE